MQNLPASYWIEKLGLSPHPEGGYFKEVYKSAGYIPGTALPSRFGGDRAFATSIYFLLEGNQFSALHRIAADEIWHFYTGTALTVYVITEDGGLQQLKLGAGIENGEGFQAVVPAGNWFGAKVGQPDGYALVGCTVSPGFEFQDFEMADRQGLLQHYPQHSEVINMLTKP